MVLWVGLPYFLEAIISYVLFQPTAIAVRGLLRRYINRAACSDPALYQGFAVLYTVASAPVRAVH